MGHTRRLEISSLVLLLREKANSYCAGNIKGALSCLRKFLATEIPLKTTKNAFYFTLKVLFVLNIFKFLF